MRKGVVMEVGEKHAIVLTETGQFLRVSRQGQTYAVGDGILLPAARRSLPRRSLMLWSSAAACMFAVVLLFSLMPGGTPQTVAAPVAYVTIDVNPSVEFGIDKDQKVVLARGQNEEAVPLMEGLVLEGLPLGDAVRLLMEQVDVKLLQSRTEADIVITSVVMEDTAEVVEEELQARVQSEVQRVIQENHAATQAQFRVTVWSAPKEVREQAEQVGLSAGKMTFLLKAKASGAEVTVEELAKESIHNVAKRFEEKQLLAPDPSFTKETIRGLLEKETKERSDERARKESPGKKDDDDKDDDDREDDKNDKKGSGEDRKGDKKDDKKDDKKEDREKDRKDDQRGTVRIDLGVKRDEGSNDKRRETNDEDRDDDDEDQDEKRRGDRKEDSDNGDSERGRDDRDEKQSRNKDDESRFVPLPAGLELPKGNARLPIPGADQADDDEKDRKEERKDNNKADRKDNSKEERKEERKEDRRDDRKDDDKDDDKD